MGTKKKIGLGVASAALGLALVGGGTWAAFNDIESTHATYAAGTLDLNAKETSARVSLSNLKPGDKFKKEFTFKNDGSLAIKEVLMQMGFSNFVDGNAKNGGKNSAEDFLKQFKVSVLTVGVEGGNGYPKNIILDSANLYDLYNMSVKKDKASMDKVKKLIEPGFLHDNGKINVATINGKTAPEYDGIPKDPYDFDKVEMVIEFVNDTTTDSNGNMVQNKYQGDSVQLDFSFEATQWNGLTIDGNKHADEKGYVKENERAHSEDK
ncbi:MULTISPECIES: biofilm matrix protein TasA [Bacillus]|uniref:Spore coat protein n=1 Tax=Bacillus glycinifermentans TaxID=1664069 RepID=A0AAJ4D3F8_9BACI|nr:MULTISPECIES: TasA family protein [Bacillus]KKB74529.1 spore coat protein [Bacillus sp. TH008]MBU8788307.1 M73 family metallopeptidase [Bacillus glycinifermentans]MDU0072119.1 TasA family protein [Bacillus sp. IG6]MED8019822.1 TasA family protein [Bacillus glycinifermentans]NUJ18554.1 spore coat protein [Bacillus glycinifermentans]